MIIPMITTAIVLGRAFDYSTMTIKNEYIYDSNSIKENLETIQRAQTSSQYRLMEYSSEVNDFLDIDGELSLKVKKGQIGLQGFGDYMRKKIDREKTIEVLITVYHETVTETFPSYTELRHNWQDLTPDKVGSHYIRSITYGGQLIISYLLKANSTEYMQEIKAAVNANLAISGSFDGSLKGNIDKLNKEIASISTTEIRAYATAGAISPVTTLEQAFKLADEYPSKVANISDGKGSPLKFEIISLNTISAKHKEYRKNLALDAMLSEATNKYDDVDVSYDKFYSWAKSKPFDDEEQKLVDDYYDKIIKARDAFQAAIRDLKGDGGLDQFDAAFKAYGEGADNIPNRFARDLLKLQSTIEKREFVWYPYTKAVSYYIHWGSVNCTLPSPEPLYLGLASTAPQGFGNGGTIECLSVNPKPALEEKKLTDGTTISVMNGMTYRLPDDSTGPVLCSFCRLENATSIVTIPGRVSCPEETKLEYSGYLLTSRNAGTTSHFVCMNSVPDTSLPDVVIKTDVNAATLEPVWLECADCDEDEKNKYVPCAVCSR